MTSLFMYSAHISVIVIVFCPYSVISLIDW